MCMCLRKSLTLKYMIWFSGQSGVSISSGPKFAPLLVLVYFICSCRNGSAWYSCILIMLQETQVNKTRHLQKHFCLWLKVRQQRPQGTDFVATSETQGAVCVWVCTTHVVGTYVCWDSHITGTCLPNGDSMSWFLTSLDQVWNALKCCLWGLVFYGFIIKQFSWGESAVKNIERKIKENSN